MSDEPVATSQKTDLSPGEGTIRSTTINIKWVDGSQQIITMRHALGDSFNDDITDIIGIYYMGAEVTWANETLEEIIANTDEEY